ncbi:MAG: hypothetical protein IT372_24655 [Polyangiaceae bacterium]|nr:hypothetical protein [Polyangiaceae bacterium]
MSYQGKERRRHRVFITRNTEYHFRDDICVAIRDRQAKRFRGAHIALNLKLQGAVKVGRNGLALPDREEPRVGASIYFTREDPEGREHQIVTSRVERIDRPEKAVVMQYPPDLRR